jgi:hypothetical protein
VPPTPIPGGIQIPGGPLIHVWAPGDPSVTLPFSQSTLMGFDVEPSTITDRRGFSAVAYHAGTARGSDGATYNLETDIRAFEGAYVGSDGMRRFGKFAFIWVDLFEPSSGSQVHDLNGGVLASGLFWTLPADGLRFSDDGRRAVLHIEDVGVIDSFQFLSGTGTPATVSVDVEWTATGPQVQRGEGAAVPSTDAAAFLGRFAVAESTARFAGAEFGFSFRSNPGVSTAGTFAEIGQERNGRFL